MEWLQNNSFWIAIVFAFAAMYFFGHGGHGSHRGHNGDGGNGALDPKPSSDATIAVNAEQAADVNGVAPRVTNPTNAALGGMPVHTGHEAAPTPSNGKQHHRGC